MELTNQILFFFSALGVFNGLLLSIYLLFFLERKHLANTLLAILLLMLSIRIGKSVFFYFIRDLPEIYRQIGLSACFLIGPSLYYYLKTVREEKDENPTTVWLPILLMLGLIVLIGFFIPYSSYPEAWNRYVVKVIYFQWMIYLIMSGFLLRDLLQNALTKSVGFSSLETWVLVVFFTNFWICIAYQGALYLSSYFYIFGPLSFSIIFYFYLYFLVFHPQRSIFLFQKTAKYLQRKFGEHQAKDLLQKLKSLMEEKQLYKRAHLKLEDVAKEVNLSTHQLSQLLNDNLGKRFSQWVNEYRVREACRLFKTQDHLSLEGIGFDVGFSSKSTFYATFRKIKGTTPSKYRQNLLKDEVG